jgi:hypothetical protein
MHLDGLKKHHIYINPFNITFSPNCQTEYLPFLLCMPEISGSNLDPETGYSETFRNYTLLLMWIYTSTPPYAFIAIPVTSHEGP